MGIDFSHCNAHWSYSGFGQYRRRIWNQCGFSDDLYFLYKEDVWLEQISVDHPLYDFFDHSDCDGELTPEQLKKIEPILREKTLELFNKPVNELAKGLLLTQFDDYDITMGLELCNGMLNAISKNENLEFK